MNDLRTECKNPNATRQRPAQIALYETEPSGVVGQAFKFFDGLIDTSIKTIEECACESGCPLCKSFDFSFCMKLIAILGIHSSFCSEHNQVCDKQGAIIVLRSLRGDVQLTSSVSNH